MPKIQLSIDYSDRRKEQLRLYLTNRTTTDPEMEIEVLILTLVALMRSVDDIEDEEEVLDSDEDKPIRISKYKIQGDVYEHVKGRIEELYFEANPNKVPDLVTYIMQEE